MKKLMYKLTLAGTVLTVGIVLTRAYAAAAGVLP